MPDLLLSDPSRGRFGPGMQSKQFNSSPHISHFAQYSLSCFPAGHSRPEWHFWHVYIVQASAMSRKSSVILVMASGSAMPVSQSTNTPEAQTLDRYEPPSKIHSFSQSFPLSLPCQ